MAQYNFINQNQPSSSLLCLGFQQLTVSNVSIGFTVPANAIYAYFNLDAQPIRFRLDGGVPTAAIGVALIALDTVFLSGSQLLNGFRAIRQGAVDGVLNIHYFGVNK